MVKKIALKVLFLLALFVALNSIYSKWFYESDIQKYSEIINLVRDIPDNADIIYLGESSNTTFREDDLDKRRISDFIGDYFPELKTYDITKPASHAGIYKVLLEKIPRESKVKTIVVTLNLRSFNAQWIYSNLETALQKSMVLLRPNPPLINRFLLSFKAYDIKSEYECQRAFKSKWEKDEFHLPGEFPFKNVIEWDNWMAKNGITNENGKYDTIQTDLACNYIKAYGFQLDLLNNPRIKDFNEIVKYAKKRKWNLVFNLLAENTNKADRLVGDDLVNMMNKNAEILTDYYVKKGVTVVNNLNDVEDEQFIDQDWTTEHYAEIGRKKIAKNVAEALKAWHIDDYIELDHKTSFFNDCENSITWGQMQTITSEIAYSGENSSKTGENSDFSLTFEFPLKTIPDSLKNIVNVEFWLFQTSLNHEAELVIEAVGENFPYFVKGFKLKELISEIKVWKKYNRSISIPESIKTADLVKIYLHNTSRETIYIDDFKIVFKN
jgi:hypothetical protein